MIPLKCRPKKIILRKMIQHVETSIPQQTSIVSNLPIAINHTPTISIESFITFHNHYTDNKECIVVIPIYKTFQNLSLLEKNAIMQCINILGNDYEICLVLPFNLGLKEYINYFHYQFSTLRCNIEFFKDTKAYNKLCFTDNFYSSFSEYKYMLIYQTDAWVFRNELHEWCEKGYEYIGAPMSDREGGCNGGLSLRLIDKFINVEKPKTFAWEDRYYSKHMKMPSKEEAGNFSLQERQDKNLIAKEIPFGCHYTNKYFSSVLPSIVTCKIERGCKYDYSILIYNFNNYDSIKDVNIIQDNVEYICVTDNKNIQHNVWKFIYDNALDNLPTFNKCYEVRFNPFKYVSTNLCLRLDANVKIIESTQQIIDAFNEKNFDMGLMIHPLRYNFIDEYDEWVKVRNYPQHQETRCLEYLSQKGYDFNYKGLFQGTLSITRNTSQTHEIHQKILSTLYEMGDGINIERIDQIVTSFVINTYYNNLKIMPFNESIITDGVFFQWYVHYTNNKIPLKNNSNDGWLFNKKFKMVNSSNLQEYDISIEN